MGENVVDVGLNAAQCSQRDKCGLIPFPLNLTSKDFCDLRLVGIAYDPRHAFDLPDLLRRPLRITPGNEDLSFRIVAMHATDGGSRVRVSIRRHRAGVQNDEVGAIDVAGGHAEMRQISLDGRAIGLGRPAAKI